MKKCPKCGEDMKLPIATRIDDPKVYEAMIKKGGAKLVCPKCGLQSK
jgi:predicted RNA-binding Zn-ribbon protein involved in translation (DUF1610 family)